MRKGFTLVEIVIVIAIIGILAAVTIVYFKPFELFASSRENRAKTELEEIGKALQMIEAKTGEFPPDVARGVQPEGISGYLPNGWPDGPFEGSVYDYDNWSDEECIDPAADGTIQVTLREMPGYNPDGSNNWAMYFVLRGKGTPHCVNIDEAAYGECINCGQ